VYKGSQVDTIDETKKYAANVMLAIIAITLQQLPQLQKHGHNLFVSLHIHILSQQLTWQHLVQQSPVYKSSLFSFILHVHASILNGMA
jgi:hypothetical protein